MMHKNAPAVQVAAEYRQECMALFTALVRDVLNVQLDDPVDMVTDSTARAV